MLPKSMHHCAFLIITFSFSYILCIQNGKTVSSSFSSLESSSSVDKLESRHFDFPLASESQPRQSFFQQNDIDSSGFQPSTGPTGFRFPDKHQYTANTNNPNELLPSPPFGYSDPYLNNRELPNTNQQQNPHNLALNTGEQSSPAAINSNVNNLNNYPYQQHANAIPGLAHHHHATPNVPNANDFYLSRQQFPSQSPLYQHLDSTNPYYPTPAHPYQPIQRPRPTYAQAFGNYLFNGGQPNYYNRPRATPPPRPPPPPQPSNDGFDSSYRPYQDGNYPYNDLTSPSGPSTYPPQYANQFGNFGSGGSGYGTTSSPSPASANPLGSLLSSFGVGGPFAGGNPLSMQIIRGLENIARNDDLQCVPKVLCQMLGSPTRRAQLPSFITSPVLTRFVASLPSLSPALIFARAALLGLSGGEYSCARTYNKCPQDEDEILFYLNNHRGGFFKFFSEPDSHNHQDTEYTTQPPKRPSYQQQSEPSIFNFLTGLTSPTSSSSSSSNTNQGNVNSFMGEAVTNGIGSLFGNIISGFLSGQGGGQEQSQATRRKDDEHDIDEEKPEKYSDLIESNSTTTNSDVNNDEKNDEQVEGRILNNKSNILDAYVEPESSLQHDNPISFPPDNDNGNDNYDAQQFQSEFRFPNTPHRDDFVSLPAPEDSSRRGKRVNFIDDGNSNSESFSRGTKMIFPDRTGTGNLRFDNDEYFRVGKILNRHRPLDYSRESYRETTTTTTRRPTNYYSSHNSGGFDRYSSSSYYRKDYEDQQKRDEKEDTSGNVYVTNGQGVIEYYINASGKKVYV